MTRQGSSFPLLAVALWVLGSGPVAAQSDGGYGDYVSWIDWARIRDETRGGLASSFDRSGGNDDYSHYEFPAGLRTADEFVTAATIAGPGIVYRFWMPHETAVDTFLVRMYFDGEVTPRLDTTSDALLSGTYAYFGAPFVTTFAGGQVSYEPIPFADSLRIETNNRADLALRHYYQYSYVTFPPGTPVTSWTTTPAPDVASGRQAAASLFDSVGDHPGPPCTECITVSAGSAQITGGGCLVLADEPGPGVVRALRLRMDGATDAELDSLRVVVRYDGETAAAIDVPVSAFFGAGHGRAPYRSLPLGTDSAEGFYCFWPMPFRASIRVELCNDRGTGITIDSASVEIEAMDVPSDLAYLHAHHHAAFRHVGQQRHDLLTTNGSGHYVGSFLSVSQDADDPWLLEGDDVLTVDGIDVLNGTGLEDVYNGGYYYNWAGDPGPEPEGPNPTSAVRALHGLLFADVGVDSIPLTRTDQYRWRIADRVPFEKSLLVQIEAIGYPGTRYESVAFWYGAPPSDTGFGALESSFGRANGTAIERVAPNPTTGETRITYAIDVDAEAVLEIVDVAGRHVATLASGRHQAGRHQAVWSPRSHASSVYFCRLRAAHVEASRKIVVARTGRR